MKLVDHCYSSGKQVLNTVFCVTEEAPFWDRIKGEKASHLLTNPNTILLKLEP